MRRSNLFHINHLHEGAVTAIFVRNTLLHVKGMVGGAMVCTSDFNGETLKQNARTITI